MFSPFGSNVEPPWVPTKGMIFCDAEQYNKVSILLFHKTALLSLYTAQNLELFGISVVTWTMAFTKICSPMAKEFCEIMLP